MVETAERDSRGGGVFAPFARPDPRAALLSCTMLDDAFSSFSGYKCQSSIHFAFWIIETATPCYDIFGAQRVNAIISSRPLDCLPRYLRLYSGGGAPSKGWLQVIDLSLNLRPCYKT